MKALTSVSRELNGLHDALAAFTSRNICEAISMIEGVKPVMRLAIPASAAEMVAGVMSRLGATFARAPWRTRTVHTNAFGDVYTENVPEDEHPAGDVEVFISRQHGLAQRACEVAGTEEGAMEYGLLLGYPPCCITKVEEVSEERDWLTVLLESSELSRIYPFGANRIAYLFTERTLGYDYYPCSLHCRATAALAAQTGAMLGAHGLAELAQGMAEEMRTPILIRRGVVLRLRGARQTGERVSYDLSRAEARVWKVVSGIEDDLLWQTSEIVKSDQALTLSGNGHPLACLEERTLDDRLLVFA
jgi:hypothetical protein